MDVKVLYHGRCFDGFSSAAAFTRFYREVIDPNANFRYQGLRHDGPEPVDTSILDGEVNAIVDFRYSPSPQLNWWFDHHRSAFVNQAERDHFDLVRCETHFWDPQAPSCCGYMARQVASKYGFNIEQLSELIHWADLTDTASYKDAQEAVTLEAPALQLMSVLEFMPDGDLAQTVIEGLASGALMDVANMPEIQNRFEPILAQQQAAVQLIDSRSEITGDTLFIDLSGGGPVVYNKFVPYYLHPNITYVVVLIETADRIKISVGSNPWRPEQRRHDISTICESYGGGGHPVVGGITAPQMTRTQALSICGEIVHKLTSG